MKKLLLVFGLLFFTCLNANAYQIIDYNNTGSIRSITRPGQGYQFGSNALFTEENIRRKEYEERMKKHEDQYYDSLKNSKNINVNINDNRSNRFYPVLRNYYYNGNSYPQTRTRYYTNGYNNFGSNRGFFVGF